MSTESFANPLESTILPMPLQADPLPLRMNDRGGVLVGKTRVPLETVVFRYDQGRTAEEIVEMYDVLELADVYATIAYILRHRPEVDAYMKKCEEEEEAAIAMCEQQPGYAELKEKIRMWREQMQSVLKTETGQVNQ